MPAMITWKGYQNRRCCRLYGPRASNSKLRPLLSLTYHWCTTQILISIKSTWKCSLSLDNMSLCIPTTRRQGTRIRFHTQHTSMQQADADMQMFGEFRSSMSGQIVSCVTQATLCLLWPNQTHLHSSIIFTSNVDFADVHLKARQFCSGRDHNSALSFQLPLPKVPQLYQKRSGDFFEAISISEGSTSTTHHGDVVINSPFSPRRGEVSMSKRTGKSLHNSRSSTHEIKYYGNSSSRKHECPPWLCHFRENIQSFLNLRPHPTNGAASPQSRWISGKPGSAKSSLVAYYFTVKRLWTNFIFNKTVPRSSISSMTTRQHLLLPTGSMDYWEPYCISWHNISRKSDSSWTDPSSMALCSWAQRWWACQTRIQVVFKMVEPTRSFATNYGRVPVSCQCLQGAAWQYTNYRTEFDSVEHRFGQNLLVTSYGVFNDQ